MHDSQTPFGVLRAKLASARGVYPHVAFTQPAPTQDHSPGGLIDDSEWTDIDPAMRKEFWAYCRRQRVTLVAPLRARA